VPILFPATRFLTLLSPLPPVLPMPPFAPSKSASRRHCADEERKARKSLNVLEEKHQPKNRAPRVVTRDAVEEAPALY
jgi:hypothetical protein